MFRWISSRRTALRFLLFLGALFALFHGVRYAIRQSGKAELHEIQDRLDATDPGWRSAHIDSEHGQLPDEQNAALLIPKLRSALDGAKLDFLLNADRNIRPFEPPNRLLSREQLVAIDQALSKVPAALALARSYRKFTRGSRRIDPSKVYMGGISPVRPLGGHFSCFR